MQNILSCDDVRALLERDAVENDLRESLAAHLASCRACRELADEQAGVSALLRSRPPQPVPAGFAARVTARIEEEAGWLGAANWRAWTFRLAPVATVLVLFALLGGGATRGSGVDSAAEDAVSPFAEWTSIDGGQAADASVLWDPHVSGDALVETVLTAEPGGSLRGDR